MTRSSARKLVCGGLLVFCLLCALPAAMPATAWADERSGSAIVEYSPQTWPFAVTASGRGQLELVGVRSVQDAGAGQRSSQAPSPLVVVRDGTVEIEVSRGQLLDFRIVPDEGSFVASVLVDGEDVSGAISGEGLLTLAAEDAQVDIEVAFGTAPLAEGGGTDASGGIWHGLTRTGDGLWIGVSALVLVALCAWCATRYANRFRFRADDANEVQPHESA